VDFSIYFRFLIALLFVLALIGILAWVARRLGVLRGTMRARNGTRRIDVIEIAPIDSKRRLALIRRDQTEHLILLGTTGDLIVETGITAATQPQPSNPVKSTE
jgi:flagellar protein FliO/FliZ